MKPLTNTLNSLIAEHGLDIINQPQRLKAMLADLLPHDKRLRYLLELSLRADIPKKIMAIQNETVLTWDAKINSLKHYFKQEYFIEDKAVKSIFECWVEVFPRIDVNQTVVACEISKTLLINGENTFKIVRENGLSGFEDSTGLKITDVKYEDVRPFCEGLAAVQLNKKWGFIDIYGNEIIPNIYNKVIDFSNGLSCVIKDSKKIGYINRQNIEVIPIVFELPLFPDNSLIKKFKDVWSLINSKLKFSENLVAIKFNNKFGFFNNQGKQVIPFIYDNTSNFSCGLACVKLNGKWGYINKSGNIIIEIKYDKVSTFTNGVAIVSIEDKYWHINETGSELYKIRYDRVYFFSENLARVVLNRKYGYIDLNGDVIIPLQYNFASDFCNGKALVTFEGVEGMSGHIDINGELISLNRLLKKSIVFKSDYNKNLIPPNNFLVPPKNK